MNVALVFATFAHRIKKTERLLERGKELFSEVLELGWGVFVDPRARSSLRIVGLHLPPPSHGGAGQQPTARVERSSLPRPRRKRNNNCRERYLFRLITPFYFSAVANLKGEESLCPRRAALCPPDVLALPQLAKAHDPGSRRLRPMRFRGVETLPLARCLLVSHSPPKLCSRRSCLPLAQERDTARHGSTVPCGAEGRVWHHTDGMVQDLPGEVHQYLPLPPVHARDGPGSLRRLPARVPAPEACATPPRTACLQAAPQEARLLFLRSAPHS